MDIDEQSKIHLNGVPQFISIRAEKGNVPCKALVKNA